MVLPKLEKWQKICITLCGIGILFSILLFVPIVQNLILDFGENFVVHRPLTRPVWIGRFVKWGVGLCVFFVVAGGMVYCSCIVVNIKEILNGKIFVYVNVIFFTYLYLITELLSVFQLLTRKCVLFCWLGFIIIGLCGICIYNILKIKNADNKKIEQNFNAKQNKVFLFQLLMPAIFFVVLGFLAWVTVPFNWDSMTYHCSRVMNWIQNKSVDYFSTNCPRQLYTPPLAEYTTMFTYFLFNSDIAFNIVQYYSYVVSAIMIYLICRKLKICATISLMGALLALSMPIAIAESITTQTDLFSSMWLLFFVYVILDFVNYEKIQLSSRKIINLVFLSCIVGLGFLSKTQICVPILFFLVWLLTVRIIKKDNIVTLFVFLFIASFIIFLFGLPYFVRNYKSIGNILAMNFFSNVAIGTAKPNYVFINILKNWGHSCIINNGRFLNKILIFFIKKIALILNVDIDSALISFVGAYEPSVHYHCDNASAYFIGWGFLISIIAEMVLIIRNIKNKEFLKIPLKSMKLVLCVSAISIFAYIRWQPWITRLLLPIYMLMILFCILVINDFFCVLKKDRLKKIFVIAMSFILFFSSFPAIAYQAHYFENRLEAKDKFRLYFEDSSRYEHYNEIINYVKAKNYKKIGLYLGGDTHEYQLWVGLKTADTDLIQVVYDNSNLKNIPECIIAIQVGGYELEQTLNYSNMEYKCLFNAHGNPDYAVLEYIGN